jgi:hypothetical protein
MSLCMEGNVMTAFTSTVGCVEYLILDIYPSVCCVLCNPMKHLVISILRIQYINLKSQRFLGAVPISDPDSIAETSLHFRSPPCR